MSEWQVIVLWFLAFVAVGALFPVAFWLESRSDMGCPFVTGVGQ